MQQLLEPSSARPASSLPWTTTERAIARWDLDAAVRRYRADDELLVVPEAFSAEGVDTLRAAAERLRSRVVRRKVPGYKQSGSVSAVDVRALAPELVALYESPSLVEVLSRVAGAPLLPCPERDLHACALYYYTEKGDGIGWHFDTSHYAGARYTVLVGVVNRTRASRLRGILHKKDPTKEHVEISVSTEPGTLVFFNGDRLWHSVSKLDAGEERIVLTMEYVTDVRMSPFRRWLSDVKDAATYFGFRPRRR